MQTGQAPSARDARAETADILAGSIAPQAQRFSLVVGDFNFVTDSIDRATKRNGKWSGHTDLPEADSFDKTLSQPH